MPNFVTIARRWLEKDLTQHEGDLCCYLRNKTARMYVLTRRTSISLPNIAVPSVISKRLPGPSPASLGSCFTTRATRLGIKHLNMKRGLSVMCLRTTQYLLNHCIQNRLLTCGTSRRRCPSALGPFAAYHTCKLLSLCPLNRARVSIVGMAVESR